MMEPPPPPPPPLFNYGDFLLTIDVYDQFNNSMFEFICNNSPLMDYATTNRLYEKYVDEGHIVNNVREECRNEVLGVALQVDIYRQLTWTLCQLHPETIKSLIIPLKDIQRYIDCAHRFTSLFNVRFSGPADGWGHSYMRAYDWNLPRLEQREFDRLIEGMIEFVRRHTSIHKNVLRSVWLPHSNHLYESDRYSRLDLYYGIQSQLPPLQISKKVITNWVKLLTRYADTDLSQLESLGAMSDADRIGRQEDVSKLMSRHPPVLPRCRALKHLVAETLGPDMFQWAVLVKKQKEARHQLENIIGQHSWQHRHHTSDMVPLQSIKISNRKGSPLSQELNDIAFAFSDSLEELYVGDGDRRSNRSVGQTTASPVVLHGQGWNLPRLRTLSFDMYDLELHFDMDALQRSHALESLTMHDNMHTYRNQGIRTWSVIQLTRLKRLDLKGSPALNFNMGSLHHSPCLEELTWKMARMPSPDELEHENTQETDDHELSGMSNSTQGYQPIWKRPQCTWDWHLPNLQKLVLAAIFAFMFDFQWLQHLPNLQTLNLSTISSTNRLHERHITLKDLLKSEHQQELDEGGSKEILSDRYISLSKLESIVLGGHWTFEEKVLGILFLTVAPNLHKVKFGSDCTGLTLEECIALSRRMSQIKKMHLRMRFTPDEIQRAGLVPKKDLQDEQRKKMRAAFDLGEGVFCDIQGS